MPSDNVAWGVAAVLLVVLIVGLGFLLRVHYLLNLPASIQVAFRREAGRWSNGIAILNDDTLDLYPTRSLKWNPTRQAPREDIQFELRPERDGVQIVTLVLPSDRWQLASSGAEISAMLSWIDSSAPEAEPTIA